MLFPRNFANSCDQLEVALKVLGSESWRVSAVIVLREVFESFDLASKKAAPERAVRHKTDSQLATCLKHPVLGIACPKRVFRLHGSDRVNGMGPADRFSSGFG